jgi:hypothetical protein
VVVAMIAEELLEKSQKVVKSAIHAGFGPLHKNVISRVFVHESLNRTSLMMLRAKS